MKNDHAKDIMTELSRRYDAVSDSFSGSRESSWSELDFLFNNLLEKGDRVLDIGCGNGRFYEKIAPVADYIGIDNSKELVRIARKSYPEGDFRVIDALETPFPDGEFDRAYVIALLHHIPSEFLRMKLLEEIGRVLRPGGTVVITVWDIWEKTARRKRVMKEAILSFLGLSKLDIGDVKLSWQGFDDFYFHCFSLKGLVRRCKRAGFEVIQTGKVPSKGGTNIFVVAQKVDKKGL